MERRKKFRVTEAVKWPGAKPLSYAPLHSSPAGISSKTLRGAQEVDTYLIT